MPIIKSAIKRAKQAVVRRERNVATKKDVKSAVKEFLAKPSAKALAAAHSEIDTAVKKNVLNIHTAARRKSALSKVAKEAGVKLETAKKATAKPAAKAAPKAATTKTAAKPATAKKPAAKAATVAKKPAAKTAAKKAPAKKPAAKKA